MTAIAAIGLIILLVVLLYMNPYREKIKKVVNDHKQTLFYGTYIEVYDIHTEYPPNTERLLLIRPENVILYNGGGELYYYLESTNVNCGTEHSLIKFNRYTIDTFNDTGLMPISCTNVNALSLVDYFLQMKNGVSDYNIILEPNNIHYSIVDIINLVIQTGFVQMK